MAHIQTVAGNGAEPYSGLTLTGVVPGNTILVGVHIGGSAASVGTISVSDNVNAGDYDQDESQVSPAGDDANQIAWFRKLNTGSTGDRTITVNATGTTLFVTATASEYGGELLPDDGVAEGNANGNNATNYTSPSITTTGTNRLIIGIIGSDTTPPSGFAPNGGETERGENNGRIQVQEKAAATAGSYTMSWSMGGSTDVACIAVAYYEAGSGQINVKTMTDTLVATEASFGTTVRPNSTPPPGLEIRVIRRITN